MHFRGASRSPEVQKQSTLFCVILNEVKDLLPKPQRIPLPIRSDTHPSFKFFTALRRALQ